MSPVRYLLIVILMYWPDAVQPKPLHHFMTSDDLERLLGAKGYHDLPDYELTTPTQTDHKGDYLSHDLTTQHTRARREEQHLLQETPAHFQFMAFGELHRMTVKPNSGLLAPGFFMQIHGDNDTVYTDFEMTYCYFVGKLTSHSSESHVAISNCDGLMGVVVTHNGHTYVQPLPDHLIKGSGNPNNHTHVVYKRSSTPPTGITRRPGYGTADCGVEGSLNETKYTESATNRWKILNGDTLSEPLQDAIGQPYIIEGLVVGDSDLYVKHGSNARQVKRYIVTLMNIASSLYNQFNLGFNVRLVLTRIRLFTSEAAQRNNGLYINQDSQATLNNFCQWHVKSKPKSSDDPLDYDHAFLFIGRGMCFGRNEDCWELGRAWIEGMCSNDYACSVNADKGLQIGFVFAHELGHNLGMLHDGANGRCRAEDGYVMKSSTAEAQRIFLFSSCSKNYLLNYLTNGNTQCLNDVPIAWEPGFGRSQSYEYPGRLYNRDQQCKFSFGSRATYCYKEPDFADPDICNRIWCDDKDYPVCISTYTGAADGTPCDSNFRGLKICYKRECIPVDDAGNPLLPAEEDFQGGGPISHTDAPPQPQPQPGSQPTVKPTPPDCVPDPSRDVVDGQWNSWSSFTPCGRSCGGGFRYRERQCVNPTPSNCGRDCAGQSIDIKFCNFQPCPGNTDYRLAQCQQHNNLKKGIDLVPDYNVPEEHECLLKCESISDVHFSDYVDEAAEGTLCNNNNTNDRCLYGKCHPVGCDNVYGSTKQNDRCGVCGGTGLSRDCSSHSGLYRLQHQWSDYYDVVEIPKGASRIVIAEENPSSVITLALSTSRGFPIFNEGGEPFDPEILTKNAAGSSFTYQRPEGSPEIIESDGPINQPIIVRMYYAGSGLNPGIEYSFQIPKSQSVTDPRYGWVSRRSACSSSCGKGTISTEFRCAIRSSGIDVDESQCLGIPTPQRQKEKCDAGSCAGKYKYFWSKKSWEACSVTCGTGFQNRKIICKNGNTSKKVDKSNCQGLPRPETSRTCIQPACDMTTAPTTTPATTPTPAVGSWIVGDWSDCSATCGNGQQTRTVACSTSICPDPKPASTQSCKLQNCCTQDKNVKVCNLLLQANCIPGCTNNVVKKFCCKSCSQPAT